MKRLQDYFFSSQIPTRQAGLRAVRPTSPARGQKHSRQGTPFITAPPCRFTLSSPRVANLPLPRRNRSWRNVTWAGITDSGGLPAFSGGISVLISC